MSATLTVDGREARRCSKCQQEKPLTEFYLRNKTTPDRLPYCRDCDNTKPRSRGARKLIQVRARHRATAELIKRHDPEFRDLLAYFTATAEDEANALAAAAHTGDDNKELAPRLKPGSRRTGQTAKQRIDIARCSHCIRNHDRGHACAKCGTVPTHALHRASDGVVDEVAIERRIAGEAIALTSTELGLAVQRMAGKKAGVGEIAQRLRLSGARVNQLLDGVTA